MNERQQKTKSLEVPNKIKIDFTLNGENSMLDRENIQEELDNVKSSRETPLNKRWKPEEKVIQRSRSAHPIGRLKLPDNCWVIESSSYNNLEEEKERRKNELDSMKQARLETNIQELDRPSSRLQEKTRQETLKELEFVKTVRKEGVNEDEFTVEGMGQHDFSTDLSEAKVVKFSEVITSKNLSDNFNLNAKDSHLETKSNKFHQISDINKQQERARSPKKEKTSTIRSRSLSTLKNVGQKVKDLTNEKLKKFGRTKK